MIAMPDKQRGGVLEAARTNTEFIDSTRMQRLLETSDFDLGELKTNPRGLTIYLTLPQRFMETHYRWLRLMITLAVGEMERIKGRTATGQPTLFVLDEFAGLKRMEVIENAAAQAAGMGIKFLFVVQNLAQLNEVYEKSWETFFGNSGLKLFFQIDDDFSRSYLSRQLGELETVRQTRSGSESQSTSWSTSDGRSFSRNVGTSAGTATGSSTGRSKNYGGLLTLFLAGRSRQWGKNWSRSRTETWGRSDGTSFSRSQSGGDSTNSGWAEGVHKRPLLNPDEIGRLLARVDDRRRPGYPGLVLALVPGEHPLLARRVNYFELPRFRGYFDPHPNHPPPPTLADLAQRADGGAPGLAPHEAPHDRLIGIILQLRSRFGSLTPRGAVEAAARFLRIAIGIGLLTVAAGLIFFFGAAVYYGLSGKLPPASESSNARPAVSPNAPAPPVSQPKAAPDSTGQDTSSTAPTSRSPAYLRGVANWDSLQQWFNGQTGDRLAGAEYWAGNRNVPGHVNCGHAAAGYNGNRPDFAAGCLDAERLLDTIDEQRKDTDYRSGFSDEAKRLPLSSPSENSSGGDLGLYETVSAPNLNLRAGPGPGYDLVTVMPQGTKVKIVRDADNGWKELEIQGSDGQVLHGYAIGVFLTPAQ